MSDIESKIAVSIDTGDSLSQLRELTKGINDFAGSVSKASQSSLGIKQIAAGLNAKGFSTEFTQVQTSVQNFGKALEAGKLSFGEYFKTGLASTKVFSKAFKEENKLIEGLAGERVKTLQTTYVNIGKAANGLTNTLKVVPKELTGMGLSTAIATQKAQIFHKVLEQGTTQLINWGKNTQWAGRQIMVGFTVPLAIASSKAKQIFADLEKEALRFRRVYGDMFTTSQDTERALDDMKALAREMTKYGVAVKDTIRMSADAAAAGKQNAELRSAVAEAIRLSVLGEVEQQQALQTTIALQNAFKISAQNLAGTIDYLNAVENQSVLSIQDITAAIPRLGPIIQQLGGNIKDTTVFLAAMRESGVSAEQGANALKSGLASLINPSTAAIKAVGDLGGGIQKMVADNEGDLMGMVTTFANAMNTLSGLEKQQVMEKVFGKFQYARVGALLDNITQKGSQAQQVLALANQSALELAALSSKELLSIESSPVTKLEAAFEKLRMTVAPIGKSITEGLAPIVNIATFIADGFVNMQGPIKSALAILFGAAPIMIMLVGLTANFIGNLLKMAQKFRDFQHTLNGVAKETKYQSQAQLEAIAVNASLEGQTNKLTNAVLLQKAAYEQLILSLRNYSSLAKLSVPGGMAAGGARMHFASGGRVPGAGNQDSVPALLMPGETVVTKQATSRFAPILDAMNSGRLKLFSQGGRVGVDKTHTAYDTPYLPGTQAIITAESALRHYGDTLGKELTDKLKLLVAISKELGVSIGEFKLLSNQVVELPQVVNNRLKNAANPTMSTEGYTGKEFGKIWQDAGTEKWKVSAELIGTTLAESATNLKRVDAKIIALFKALPENVRISDENLPKYIDKVFQELIKNADKADTGFIELVTGLRGLKDEFNVMRVKVSSTERALAATLPGVSAGPGVISRGGVKLWDNSSIKMGTGKSYIGVETEAKRLADLAKGQAQASAIEVVQSTYAGLIAGLKIALKTEVPVINKTVITEISEGINFSKISGIKQKFSAEMNNLINGVKLQTEGSVFNGTYANNRAVQIPLAVKSNDAALDNQKANAANKYVAATNLAIKANVEEAQASMTVAKADEVQAGFAARTAKSAFTPGGMFGIAMALDSITMASAMAGQSLGSFGKSLTIASNVMFGVMAVGSAIKNIAPNLGSTLINFATINPALTALAVGVVGLGAAFYLLTRKTASAADKMEAAGVKAAGAISRSANSVEMLFSSAKVAKLGTPTGANLTDTSFSGQDDLFKILGQSNSFKGIADATTTAAKSIFNSMNIYGAKTADLKVVVDQLSNNIAVETGRTVESVKTDILGQLSSLVAPNNTDVLRTPLEIEVIAKLGNEIASPDKIKVFKAQLDGIVADFNKAQVDLSKAIADKASTKTQLRNTSGAEAQRLQMLSSQAEQYKKMRADAEAILNSSVSTTKEKQKAAQSVTNIDAILKEVAAYDELNRQLKTAGARDKAVSTASATANDKATALVRALSAQYSELNKQLAEGAIGQADYNEKVAGIAPLLDSASKANKKYINGLSPTALKQYNDELALSLSMMKVDIGKESPLQKSIDGLQGIFKNVDKTKISVILQEAVRNGFDPSTMQQINQVFFSQIGDDAKKTFEKFPELIADVYTKMNTAPSFLLKARDVLAEMASLGDSAKNIDIVTRLLFQGQPITEANIQFLKQIGVSSEAIKKIRIVMEGPVGLATTDAKTMKDQMFKDAEAELADQISGLKDEMQKNLDIAMAQVELKIRKDGPAKFAGAMADAFKEISGTKDIGKSITMTLPAAGGGTFFLNMQKSEAGALDATTKLERELDKLGKHKLPIQDEIDKISKTIDGLNTKLDEGVKSIDNMFQKGPGWKKFGDDIKAMVNTYTRVDTLNGKAGSSPVLSGASKEFKFSPTDIMASSDMSKITAKLNTYKDQLKDANKYVGSGLDAWKAIDDQLAKEESQLQDVADKAKTIADNLTKAAEVKFDNLSKVMETDMRTGVSNLLADTHYATANSAIANSWAGLKQTLGPTFDAVTMSFDDAGKNIEKIADDNTKAIEKKYTDNATAIGKAYDDIISNIEGAAEASAKTVETIFDDETKTIERSWDHLTTQVERAFEDETQAIEEGYNAQRQAAQDSFDAQAKAAEESFTAQIEAMRKANEAQIALIEEANKTARDQLAATQEAERNALERMQKHAARDFDKAQNKKKQALSASQDAAKQAIEDQFAAEADAINNAASGSTANNSGASDARQAQIDAIGAAYDLQIEALQEISKYEQFITDQKSKQVDLAGAIASGDIAAAAKAAGAMTQGQSDFQSGTLEAQLNKAKELAVKKAQAEADAQSKVEDAASQSAQDATEANKKAALAAIEARKKAALEALQIVQDAESEKLDDQQYSEQEAFDDQQNAVMDALQARQDQAMSDLEKRQTAEIDAIKERQDNEIAAIEKTHAAEVEAKQKAFQLAQELDQKEHTQIMENRSRQHSDDMDKRNLAHTDAMSKRQLDHNDAVEKQKNITDQKKQDQENLRTKALADLEENKQKELAAEADKKTTREANLASFKTLVESEIASRKVIELKAIDDSYQAIVGPAGPLQGYKDVRTKVASLMKDIESQNAYYRTTFTDTMKEQIAQYDAAKKSAQDRLDADTKSETAIKGAIEAIKNGQTDFDHWAQSLKDGAQAVNDINKDILNKFITLQQPADPDSFIARLKELQKGVFPELPASWQALLNMAGGGTGTFSSAISSSTKGTINAASNAVTNVKAPFEGDSQTTPPTSSKPGGNGNSSLKSRFVGGARSLLDESYSGLNSGFRDKVANLLTNFPGVQVHSAFRPVWYQQKLWDNALKKYGSAAAARKWVAPPGHSMHGSGLAMDLSYPNGEGSRVRAAASKYGLKFPMSWEPWHIEDSSTRGGSPAPADDGSDIDSGDSGPQYTASDLAKGMLQALLTGKFPELGAIQATGTSGSGGFIGPVQAGDVTGDRSGGSVSWRGNNPGNIRPGAFATSVGATGVIHTEKYGDFAKFPNYQTGWNAMRSLLLGDSYRNLSISDAIFKWAPPADHNNSASYAAGVARAVGAPAGTKVGQLTPEQLLAMMNKIQQTEGWVPGKIKAAAHGAYVEATHGGSLFQVGEGGKDEIISPVGMMYDTVKKAITDSFGSMFATLKSIFSSIGGTAKQSQADPMDPIATKLNQLNDDELKKKLEEIQQSKALIKQKLDEARASGKSEDELISLREELKRLEDAEASATATNYNNRDAIKAVIDQIKLNITETYNSTVATGNNTAEVDNSTTATDTNTTAVDTNTGYVDDSTAATDANTVSTDDNTTAIDGNTTSLQEAFQPAVDAAAISIQTLAEQMDLSTEQIAGIVDSVIAAANAVHTNAENAGNPNLPQSNPWNPGGALGYTGTNDTGGAVPISLPNLQAIYAMGQNKDGTNFFADQLGMTPAQAAAAISNPQTFQPTFVDPNKGNAGGLNPALYGPNGMPYDSPGNPFMAARGGRVPKYLVAGGPVGTDTVPAWLSPGEFVVNRSGSTKFGGLLDRINAGHIIPELPLDHSVSVGSKPELQVHAPVYHITVQTQSNADPNEIAYSVKRELRRESERSVRSYNR